MSIDRYTPEEKQLVYELFKNRFLNSEYKILPNGRIWSALTNKEITENSGSKGRTKYTVLTVKIKGKVYRVVAHRIIYPTYVGPLVDGMTINHKNGDKLDNRPNNLEQITEIENRKHAMDYGLSKRSFTMDQIELIVKRLENGESTKSLSLEYEVNQDTICKLRRGKYDPRVR